MDKLKAAALVGRQRCRWQSQESDLRVAQRARRAYLLAAAPQALAAVVEAIVAALSKRPGFLLPAVGFLLGGMVLYWGSRGFAQAMALLGDVPPIRHD